MYEMIEILICPKAGGYSPQTLSIQISMTNLILQSIPIIIIINKQ